MADNSARPSLLDFSPELYFMIVKKLPICDRDALMRTSKNAYVLTLPSFYHKIYTKSGTKFSTVWLLQLLNDKPEIIPMIHYLVIDEYDMVAFRRLLSREMPNLESIIMQHDGEVDTEIDEADADFRSIQPCQQPRMTNFTFSTEIGQQKMYRVPAEDFCLFRHPQLKRMRLSYLDLRGVDDLELDYFQHEHLEDIIIEVAQYSVATLQRFVTPCKALRDLRLHTDYDLPFPEKDLPEAISSAVDTLKILKILWRLCKPISNHGMDMTKFTALRMLSIDPVFLLGRFTVDDDILPLLRARLPPLVRYLSLDNLVPRVARPAPPPGMGIELLPSQTMLIKTLMQHRGTVFPNLDTIFMYYLENMANERELYAFARKQGVLLAGLYATDDITPTYEALETPRTNLPDPPSNNEENKTSEDEGDSKDEEDDKDEASNGASEDVTRDPGIKLS